MIVWSVILCGVCLNAAIAKDLFMCHLLQTSTFGNEYFLGLKNAFPKSIFPFIYWTILQNLQAVFKAIYFLCTQSRALSSWAKNEPKKVLYSGLIYGRTWIKHIKVMLLNVWITMYSYRTKLWPFIVEINCAILFWSKISRIDLSLHNDLQVCFRQKWMRQRLLK